MGETHLKRRGRGIARAPDPTQTSILHPLHSLRPYSATPIVEASAPSRPGTPAASAIGSVGG